MSTDSSNEDNQRTFVTLDTETYQRLLEAEQELRRLRGQDLLDVTLNVRLHRDTLNWLERRAKAITRQMAGTYGKEVTVSMVASILLETSKQRNSEPAPSVKPQVNHSGASGVD